MEKLLGKSTHIIDDYSFKLDTFYKRSKLCGTYFYKFFYWMYKFIKCIQGKHFFRPKTFLKILSFLCGK